VVLIPYTKEFTNLLRNCKRKETSIYDAYEKAVDRARSRGIDIERSRKKKIKRAYDPFDLGDLDI